MISKGQFVFIGKVHSAQGLKGDLYISIFAEEAEWADQWETLYLSKDESQPSQEYSIKSIKEHQKQKRWGFVIRLDEITNRNQSEELVGFNVLIPEDFLVTGEGEEIYLREVLGFEVIDKERGSVGKVIGFSGNSFQDLLIVKGENGKFEVPFVSPIHLETDKDKKTLLMDIPFGLVAGEKL